MIDNQLIIRHPKGEEPKAEQLFKLFLRDDLIVDYIASIGIYGVTFVHEEAQVTVSSREFDVVKRKIQSIVGGARQETTALHKALERKLSKSGDNDYCRGKRIEQNAISDHKNESKSTFSEPVASAATVEVSPSPAIRVRTGDGVWRVPVGAEREGSPGTWAMAIDVGQKSIRGIRYRW